ncbi:hypothetical protein Riv7116_6271 [Rivularia sp. PCC 7116]|uniref:MBL fold metallo-hydrolase n=1 Tax=Rivularia sp. PCC 7116 TaxID=373994 RepID=UPI00029ECB83|nr:MBL fold metallo-hydrolase [Rivularia sp. PCC 7116]AFY58620.1 hypothetical protein Riv7116_6271 [Rivularia sp. PCC 7116]
MQIHMIGHASIFVKTQDAKILMDPVLWDPFCEGLNETCPKRELIPEKLPEFDFLVISHQHLDHFDLRSLAYLPKNIDVLVPKDALIIDSLRQLGYSNIYPLKEFQKVRIGSTTLMTTRSEVRVPEFGMVFADDSGVFWNTVDTYFAPPTIQAVKAIYPQIDFLLATWHISLENKYQQNKNTEFPFELYGQLMNLIQLVEPQAIAPGAQGWKYINEAAWQNQIVFPLTRERFCHDIKQVLPDINNNIFVLDPGDILTLERGDYNLESAGCDYVKTIVDDRECLEFAPVKVGANLIDPNSDRHDIDLMQQTIHQALRVDLCDFIKEYQHNLFLNNQRWQVIYQLEITYPEITETYHIDFSNSKIKIKEGRNPLANLFTYITASSLYNLINKKIDWDYLYCSGEYRNFHKVYSLAKLGILTPAEDTLLDPISIKYSSEYVAGEHIKTELSKIMETHDISIPNNSNIEEKSSTMLNLGNILIKMKKNQKESTIS